MNYFELNVIWLSLHVMSSRLDCEAETKLLLYCRIIDDVPQWSGGAGSGGVDGGG